jgi:hypothetical protein
MIKSLLSAVVAGPPQAGPPASSSSSEQAQRAPLQRRQRGSGSGSRTKKTIGFSLVFPVGASFAFSRALRHPDDGESTLAETRRRS